MLSVISLSSTKNKMMKKGTEYLFKYIKTVPNQKNFLIEPMCCIIRLGILKYKDPGTKICIYDNSISYYEPTIIQGILRTWNGDNREDLHNLFNPIIVALRWYNPAIPFNRTFFERCRNGILTLKKVYENNSTIHHTLNHYIKTINEALERNPIKISHKKGGIHVTFHEHEKYMDDNIDDKQLEDDISDTIDESNEFLKKLSDNFSIDCPRSLSDSGTNDPNDPNEGKLCQSTIKNDHINFIEVFKELWSENELNIINSTFNQLDDILNNKEIKDEYQRKDIMKTYLNSIELIVKQKERQVQGIITTTLTTY
jgi:hypothetical protein